MTTPQATVREIPLEQLVVSETRAQTERRKHINQAALAELAESIKTVGVLQPIVVRRLNDQTLETYQIVCGERRMEAAEKAGLESIPATVRELSDQQVLEIQLVENLQRQDLHELAEAEGYEALMKHHGYTVEDLVAKVGKSRGTVYARLKLLALGKEARAAFYDGKLTASTALLIARIPEALQKKALKEITKSRWDGGAMSYREASAHIHEEYMLRLDQAGFPTADAELVPAAGACGPCPKRTGNQPELFGDVGRADVCTDPVCFRAKREAHKARRLAAAAANGQRVIVGKEAKQIVKNAYGVISTHTRLGGGLVHLDAACYDDQRSRSYRKILGKTAPPPILLEDPNSGALVEVLEQKALAPLLKEKGVTPRRASANPANREHAQRVKKAKLEMTCRQRIADAVLDKAPQQLGRTDLEIIAWAFLDEVWNEVEKKILKCMGWEPQKRPGGYGLDYQTTAKKKIPELSDSELARFLLALTFARELQVSPWSSDKPERLLAAAARFGIDAGAIRQAVKAEERAKERKKKPAAKKKATTKKRAARKRKPA